MDFHELALFMIALLLATIVGCFVLIFQCQKLYHILSKVNAHGHVPQTTPAATAVQLQGLKSKVRSSAKIHHAELAEEIRAVTRMQMELTSQLCDLQTYLAQMKDGSPSQSNEDTQQRNADGINYNKDD